MALTHIKNTNMGPPPIRDFLSHVIGELVGAEMCEIGHTGPTEVGTPMSFLVEVKTHTRSNSVVVMF